MPIAATTVGGDDQLFGLWIALTPHAEPPTPDSLHGECRGVMICANAHPSLVSPDVINPVRISPSELLVNEVMNLDFYSRSTASPLLPGVLVCSDQFLLLRVY